MWVAETNNILRHEHLALYGSTNLGVQLEAEQRIRAAFYIVGTAVTSNHSNAPALRPPCHPIQSSLKYVSPKFPCSSRTVLVFCDLQFQDQLLLLRLFSLHVLRAMVTTKPPLSQTIRVIISSVWTLGAGVTRASLIGTEYSRVRTDKNSAVLPLTLLLSSLSLNCSVPPSHSFYPSRSFLDTTAIPSFYIK